MVVVKIILPLLFCCISMVHNMYRPNDPTFYNAFLEHISAPQRLVTYICRPKRTAHMYQKFNILQGLPFAICNNAKRLPEHLVQMDKITVFVNLTCKHSRNILQQAIKNNMFRRSNVWLIFGKVDQIDPSHFFSYFSQIFIVQQKEYYMEVNRIFKFTEFSKSFSLQFTYKWSLVDGKVDYQTDEFGKRFANLMDEPIRVSYAFLKNDSLNHLDDYRNVLDDQNSRVTYRLMNEICNLYNATHVPIIRTYWGDYNYTVQEYTQGMFYDLRHGIADIAGNVATMSLLRLQDFRFLASTGHLNLNELKWYFKAPSMAYTQNIWMLTFQKSLWFVILGSVIAYFVIIATVANLERRFLQLNVGDKESSWYKALDVVVTTATQRGSSIKFWTYSGNIICYSLYILALLINVAFSAHFFVLLQSSSDDINSFSKILDSGMELGCDNYSYNTYYFLNPNDRVDEKVRQKIYKTKILGRENKFFLTTSQGMELAKNGKFAFHAASTFGYYEMAKMFDEATKRSIRYVDSFIAFKMYLAIPKNSSLDDFLTAGFLYLEEAGIVQREIKLYFPQKPMPDLTKAIFSSLDLIDSYFVFLILQIGMLLSLIIFLLELLIFKTMQKNNNT